MRAYVVTLALVLGLAVSGCDDGGDAAPEPTESSSSAATPSAQPSTPSAAPTTAPVTTAEFCSLVRTVTTAEGAARAEATLEILQRGLPTDLEGEAKDGLQVLLDIAPELTGVRASVRTYRGLEKQQRTALRSFAWFVTKSCGSDYLADLLPDLPELPDLPSLPDLGSLLPR